MVNQSYNNNVITIVITIVMTIIYTYVFQCMQNFSLRLQTAFSGWEWQFWHESDFYTFYDFPDSDAWQSQWWNQKPGSRYLLGTGHENAIHFSVRFENGHPSLMWHPTTPQGPTNSPQPVSYFQWEFHDPKMEVLCHTRPYFLGISNYIGLI